MPTKFHLYKRLEKLGLPAKCLDLYASILEKHRQLYPQVKRKLETYLPVALLARWSRQGSQVKRAYITPN